MLNDGGKQVHKDQVLKFVRNFITKDHGRLVCRDQVLKLVMNHKEIVEVSSWQASQHGGKFQMRRKFLAKIDSRSPNYYNYNAFLTQLESIYNSTLWVKWFQYYKYTVN